MQSKDFQPWLCAVSLIGAKANSFWASWLLILKYKHEEQENDSLSYTGGYLDSKTWALKKLWWLALGWEAVSKRKEVASL